MSPLQSIEMIFNRLILSVSVDCPLVATLANSLNIPSLQPAIWSQIQTDCCSAIGITCTDQFVTSIVWNNLGLNGSLSNSTIFPSKLTLLILSKNSIAGNLPLIWPCGLITIWMDYNQITGTIPTTFPDTLRVLGVNGNKLTGQLPSIWPSSLTTLHVNSNSLTGELPLFSSKVQVLWLGYNNDNPKNRFTGKLVLNAPTEFGINFNWITDVNITNVSLLTTCEISNSPLLGNPNIGSLTICAQTGLYSPSLLPVTLSAVKPVQTATFLNTCVFVSKSTTVEGAFSYLSQTFTNRIYISNTIAISSPFLPAATSQTTLKQSTTLSVLTTLYRIPCSSLDCISVHSSQNLASDFIVSTLVANYTFSNSVISTSSSGLLEPIFWTRNFLVDFYWEVTVFSVIKLSVDAILLLYFISKTPFKRSLKNFKRNKKDVDLEYL